MTREEEKRTNETRVVSPEPTFTIIAQSRDRASIAIPRKESQSKFSSPVEYPRATATPVNAEALSKSTTVKLATVLPGTEEERTKKRSQRREGSAFSVRASPRPRPGRSRLRSPRFSPHSPVVFREGEGSKTLYFGSSRMTPMLSFFAFAFAPQPSARQTSTIYKLRAAETECFASSVPALVFPSFARVSTDPLSPLLTTGSG